LGKLKEAQGRERLKVGLKMEDGKWKMGKGWRWTGPDGDSDRTSDLRRGVPAADDKRRRQMADGKWQVAVEIGSVN
jgi:hypothetical protein